MYAVTYDPGLNDSGDYGEFRPHAGEIALRPHMPPTLEREILWHEVKHAVAFAAGFRDEDKKTSEEELVTRTAGGEVAVLRDNPDLAEYITS